MLLVIFLIVGAVAIATCKVELHIKEVATKLEVIICFTIFSKIQLFKINLSKHKNGLLKARGKKILTSKKIIFKVIKELNLDVEQLELKIEIGTGEPPSTAIITGIISSAIAIIIRLLNVQFDVRNVYYKVIPMYARNPTMDISFKCIISQQLAHIINVIFRNFKEWRKKQYGGKSSDRKINGNCYE